MADGFIVRKGGVTTEQALAPTITEVSTTETSITFTITNNDASTAVILYEVDDATPDANSIELATGATSGNLTVTGLSEGEHDVYATANVTGKVKSNVTELTIEIVPIIYTAATGGTTLEYNSGGKRFKSHTFTSDGNFVVSTVGDNVDDRNKVDFLVIAGGGSGSTDDAGAGGGGAGGFRTTAGTQGGLGTLDPKFTVTATTFAVVVGAGGTGVTGDNARGNNGNNSSALGVTSIGGGTGGVEGPTNPTVGGSGGGGNYNPSLSSGVGAAGTANQGRKGGNGFNSSPTFPGGGGGGAGADGVNATSTVAGAGGVGLSNNLRTGSSETRAGGGGASTRAGATAGAGGAGGGGTGHVVGGSNPTSGTANTGSGGGAASTTSLTSGAGGKGIVVIRYEIAPSV